MLGLAYNMESDGVVHLTNGPVNITDMTDFYPNDQRVQPEVSVQQSTAHLYGDSKNFSYREKLYPRRSG